MRRSDHGYRKINGRAAGIPTGGPPFVRVAALVCVVVSALIGGCQQRPQEEPRQVSPVLEPVSLCRPAITLLQLVVADVQGLFAEQGLEVTFRELPMGRDALEAMLNGDCEFAAATELPVAEYALSRDDFRIISVLQSSDNLSRIVARADRGISRPSDLRGKRFATVKGTAPHYFLELFLDRDGIAAKEVTISFMKSDALLGALTSGQVDAIAIPNGGVWQAQQALGANAVVLEARGLCRNFHALLASKHLLAKRPAVAVKLIRALARADDFIQQHPDETETLARSTEPLSPEEARQALGVMQYRLSLDHALLMGLEDIARWNFQLNGETLRPSPNFIKLIDPEPLRTVRPEAVNLTKQ